MKTGLHGWLAMNLIVAVASATNAPTTTASSPTPPDIRALLDAGKLSEAETEAKELLEAARSRDGPRSVAAAKAMDFVVEARDKAGKADSVETLTLARNAVSIKEQVLGRQHPELATSLELLAITLQLLERYPEAQKQFERALRIREQAKPPDPAALAACLQRMASLNMQRGDYVAARALFERLEPILERGQGPTGAVLAGTYYNMGQCLYRLGDFTKAQKCYERSRSIVLREFGPGHPLNGWISNSLGNLHDDTGDFDLARSDYEEAIHIADLIGRNDFKSSCLNNLGALYRDFGDYAAAETSFTRALQIEKDVYGSHSAEAARTIYNLARLFYLAGDSKRALSLADTSLSMRREVLGPDHSEVGDSLWLLGLCKLDAGDAAGAVPLLERAEEIFEAHFGPEHWDVSEAKYGLARAMEATGNEQRALALYREALQIKQAAVGPDHPFLGEISSDFATFLARTGKGQEAFGLAVRAARVVDRHVEAMIVAFPERQAFGYAAISKRSLDVALSLLDATSGATSISKCWDALIHSRAQVVEEMARRNQSLGDSKDSEVVRLKEERSSASRRLAHLLVRGPESEGASGDYRRQVDDARRKVEDIERRLGAKSRAFRETRAGTQVGFKEMANALPKGSALVAYALYEDALHGKKSGGDAPSRGRPSYLAFVLRAGESPKAVDLGPAAVVDTLVAEFRRESAAPGSERAYRDTGAKLRGRVWDVLRPYVGDARQVFMIHDGTLAFVNVYALPIGADQYVVERDPLIVPLVAERNLVSLQKEATLGRGLLAIGGPDFDQQEDAVASLGSPRPAPLPLRAHRGTSSDCEALQSVRFDPLPASTEEAKAVANLWGNQVSLSASASSNVLFLEGAKATEASFKSNAPGRRILHLATHGFFLGDRCGDTHAGGRGIAGHSPKHESDGRSQFEDAPLYLSGLVLAGANQRNKVGSDGEDGILTAEEISALDLRGVEWGVLSACESGLGTLEAREGIRGLRCAFQAAGVRTLIMSLWAVDDQSTREWMTDLYAAHFSKKLSTAESIREASREVLVSRRRQGISTHPFFWAGFVGTGDWR